MPSSIGSVSQLVAAIRSQLAPRVELSGQKAARPSARGTPRRAGASTRERLESSIGMRINSIERDDPQRGRKAFRIFLESILLSHLGEHLINDPRFYQLVDDVQGTMESDAELGAMVDKAIAHLTTAPR
ncbi:hypothetical protein IV454_23855 [Massilia antarctica]|uniref:Uncharacterized protein n=1 Tax=Massilia antarctica TaxID=2765360 RepID=A0AA48WB96_9BURK|nr:hypothetical protein [Massilia antarctica]QPI48538.1 hypothetical protein IV454_23855 [Massilia antarctica]